MKSRLIVNPVSGTDSGPDYLRLVNERLRAGVGELDIVMTVGECDAADAAERAAREGDCDRLFVAGGDGTLNEAVNGVARVPGALSRITFGLIPLGTGNDFAAALGLPEDVEAALEILLAGRTVETDVGVLTIRTGAGGSNERRFVNVSAGGFIAEVSDAVDPRLKTVAGKLAYLVGGAQVLFEFEPVRARVEAFGVEASDAGGSGQESAGEREGATAGVASRVAASSPVGASPSGDVSSSPPSGELSLHMFAVCNSRQVGGGRLIAPGAVIDDGLLDVCLVEAMPTLEFLSLLARVGGGGHVADERVRYFRARALEMTFERPIKVNTDGEVLETAACGYSVLPRAARFLAGDAPYLSENTKRERDKL